MDTEETAVKMEMFKEHGQTIQYKAVPAGKPPAIDRVYIAKWALGVSPPKEITITIK